MNIQSRKAAAVVAGLGIALALGAAMPTQAFAAGNGNENDVRQATAEATNGNDAKAPEAVADGPFSIGGQGYATIGDAVKAAKAGDVITVSQKVDIKKADVGITGHVTVPVVFAKGSDGSTVSGVTFSPEANDAKASAVTVDATNVTFDKCSFFNTDQGTDLASLLLVNGGAKLSGATNVGSSTSGGSKKFGAAVDVAGTLSVDGATITIDSNKDSGATALHVGKSGKVDGKAAYTIGDGVTHALLNESGSPVAGHMEAVDHNGGLKAATEATFAKTFDASHPVLSQDQALAMDYRNDKFFKVTSLANGKLSAVVDNTNNPFAGNLLKFVYYQDGKAYDGGMKKVDETNGNDGTITDVTVPGEVDLNKDAYLVAYLGNGVPLFKSQLTGQSAEPKSEADVPGGEGTEKAGTLEQTGAMSPAAMGAVTGLGAIVTGLGYALVSKRK